MGVYEISKLLAAPHRLKSELSGVLTLLSSFLDMHNGLIALLTPEGEAEMLVGPGWSEDKPERFFERLPERVIGQIVVTKMPLVVPNVRVDPLFAGADVTNWAPDDGRPFSMIGVPIKDAARVVGTLTVIRGHDDARLDDDVRFLTMVAPALRRVTLSEDQIVVEANVDALSPAAFDMPGVAREDGGHCRIQFAFHMRRRQGAVVLEPSGRDKAPSFRIDKTLIRAIALARQWAIKLESGKVESVRALARSDGLCHHYVARLLPLAYLAPDLTETILSGAHSRMISLAALTARPLPIGWDEQRQRFAELAA